MTQADERPMTDLGMLPSHPFGRENDLNRRWWWPLAGGGVAIAVVAFLAGRATAPSSDDPGPPETRPGIAADILEPGPLIGRISGANRYPTDDDGVERYNFAWPGQELVAPEPTAGEAVAWQWQLCDVPPASSDDEEGAGSDEERPPLECRAVEDATEDRWESPPTNRTRLVRVIVTVDLGDGVRVRAATDPVAAIDWPDAIQPGDPPPTALPDEPPARS